MKFNWELALPYKFVYKSHFNYINCCYCCCCCCTEIELPPPGEFRISEINIYSLVLTWTIPMNSHGKIEHYTVSYVPVSKYK